MMFFESTMCHLANTSEGLKKKKKQGNKTCRRTQWKPLCTDPSQLVRRDWELIPRHACSFRLKRWQSRSPVPELLGETIREHNPVKLRQWACRFISAQKNVPAGTSSGATWRSLACSCSPWVEFLTLGGSGMQSPSSGSDLEQWRFPPI